ncbi:MAG: Ig-like domain-containing protein [Planctomycetota bacterium]
MDDVRVFQNTTSLGPKVTGTTLPPSSSNPVNEFTVTFDRSMDLASFTASDIRLRDPFGNLVELANDPVHIAQQTTFVIQPSTPLSQVGRYTFEILPNVLDLSGNPMDQQGNGVKGEGNFDRYFTTLELHPYTLPAAPLLEGFESGDFESLTGWRFITNRESTFDIVSHGQSNSGNHHLELRGSEGTVEFAFDTTSLQNSNDFTLSFWLNRFVDTDGSFADVALSDDGFEWEMLQQTITLPSTNQWYRFSVNLRLWSSNQSLFFVRLNMKEGALDDFRISLDADSDGPRVTSAIPTILADGSLEGIVVTFSEPIDVATFHADDILLSGPGGAIPITWDIEDAKRSSKIVCRASDLLHHGEWTLFVKDNIEHQGHCGKLA